MVLFQTNQLPNGFSLGVGSWVIKEQEKYYNTNKNISTKYYNKGKKECNDN